MYAFACAVAAGAEMFELDVHATADGHLVVLHDATVDRCTDGTGEVDRLTLDEIRRLDAAHWFEPGVGVVSDRPSEVYRLRGIATGHTPPPAGFAAADFTVPTLEEILLRYPAIAVNVDIKQTAPATKPYEAALGDLLRRLGRTDDVMVASFSDEALAVFRGLAPEVATSAGPSDVLAFWSYAHGHGPRPTVAYRALQVPERYEELLVVSDRFVAAAKDMGLAVHVWTVDDPESMHRLLDLGVDGIVTDRPTVLADVLAARAGATD